MRINRHTSLFPSRTTLIRNATILTAAGPTIERGSILLLDGKIAAVGQTVTAPPGALVIDASGKWVTPGVIDTHSHLGVYAVPGIESLEDGNEMTDPNTAEVWPSTRLAAGSAVRAARSPAGSRRCRSFPARAT